MAIFYGTIRKKALGGGLVDAIKPTGKYGSAIRTHTPFTTAFVTHTACMYILVCKIIPYTLAATKKSLP